MEWRAGRRDHCHHPGPHHSPPHHDRHDHHPPDEDGMACWQTGVLEEQLSRSQGPRKCHPSSYYHHHRHHHHHHHCYHKRFIIVIIISIPMIIHLSDLTWITFQKAEAEVKCFSISHLCLICQYIVIFEQIHHNYCFFGLGLFFPRGNKVEFFFTFLFFLWRNKVEFGFCLFFSFWEKIRWSLVFDFFSSGEKNVEFVLLTFSFLPGKK